jgi:hypothetical protein
MTGACLAASVRIGLTLVAGLGVLAASTPSASACGAYFARIAPATAATASSQLYNRTSKMIVARADNATTITMTADYRGDPQEFAVVIAVPAVLTREQIKIADGTLIDTLDRWSAPKLVESFDADPCPSTVASTRTKTLGVQGAATNAASPAPQRPPLGVTVEGQYVVGEYDVAVLSAQQSDGLQTWLSEAGYNVPPAAGPVLAKYIAEGMKFFVAKVNLQQKQQLGFALLRPLQITYRSPKFVVPVRLSTINADGPQEMFIFLLTSRGRVEAANYPTQSVPTGLEVPPFVKRDYAGFYRAVFDKLVASFEGRGVFIEHVSAVRERGRTSVIGLGDDKLAGLGASWFRGNSNGAGKRDKVVLTRLHVRYDAAHFPMDLMLRETDNAAPLIGRFSITHPYTGSADCPEGEQYRAQLAARSSRENANLTRLTGWSQELIREKAAGAR